MQQTFYTAASDATSPRHLLLLSPTGSGKTLAYLLPILKWIHPEMEYVQAIILLPTRELAIQGEEMLQRLGSGIRSCALYGGRPTMEEYRRMRNVRPQIVFATPGRLCDHLDKGNIDTHGLKVFVIDEYDKCLEMGFRQEVTQVARQIRQVPRIWLTSATATEEANPLLADMEHHDERGANARFHTFNFLDDRKQDEERISIYRVPSPRRDKLETLGKLLSKLGGSPAIVFVNHRESVGRIYDYLCEKGFACEKYHGGMEQDKRERALLKFRGNCACVLVATDIAARGLDIPEVEIVIHYHLPADEATFTHRSGRTARWQQTGTTYLIVGPDEPQPDFMNEHDWPETDVESIALHPQPARMSMVYIGRGKREKISKMDILGFFCKKGGLRGSDIGRIDVADHYALAAVDRTKVKSLLQQVNGEKIKGLKTIYIEV